MSFMREWDPDGVTEHAQDPYWYVPINPRRPEDGRVVYRRDAEVFVFEGVPWTLTIEETDLLMSVVAKGRTWAEMRRRPQPIKFTPNESGGYDSSLGYTITSEEHENMVKRFADQTINPDILKDLL